MRTAMARSNAISQPVPDVIATVVKEVKESACQAQDVGHAPPITNQHIKPKGANADDANR